MTDDDESVNAADKLAALTERDREEFEFEGEIPMFKEQEIEMAQNDINVDDVKGIPNVATVHERISQIQALRDHHREMIRDPRHE